MDLIIVFFIGLVLGGALMFGLIDWFQEEM